MTIADEGASCAMRADIFHCYPGKLVPDHILPKNDIRGLKGFEDLTPEQQKYLFNYPGNLQPLPSDLNKSKGARNATQWDGTPLVPKIHEDYARWLEKTRAEMTSFFEANIKFFKKLNGTP